MARIRKNIIDILCIISVASFSMSMASVANARHIEMNLDDSAALASCNAVADYYSELGEYSDEELETASPGDLAYIGAGMNLAFGENRKEVGSIVLMNLGFEMNEELLLSYGSRAMREPHPETLHLLGLASMKGQMEAVGFSDRAEQLVGMYFTDTLDNELLADLKEEGFKMLTNYGRNATNLLKHFDKTAKSKEHSALGSGLLVMIGMEIVTLFKRCRDAG